MSGERARAVGPIEMCEFVQELLTASWVDTSHLRHTSMTATDDEYVVVVGSRMTISLDGMLEPHQIPIVRIAYDEANWHDLAWHYRQVALRFVEWERRYTSVDCYDFSDPT